MLIKIPNNFLPERKYVLKVLLRDFLGLNYRLEFSDTIKDYVFILENSKTLIVKDAFFSGLEESNCFDTKNLPQNIKRTTSHFLPETEIIVLYGTGTIKPEQDQIICENDLLGGSFFMLTRWEEFICPEKDKYERFPEENSISVKNNFYHKPIVNEYLELLWQMLQYLGVNQKRKERNYQVKLTHDIDFYKKFKSGWKIIKTILGDIIVRKSFKLALKSLNLAKEAMLNPKSDPFYQFDFFMQCAERYNLKAYFYFIAAYKKEKQTTYNINHSSVKATIKIIEEKGHKIGIHAGWNTFLNPKRLNAEKRRLEVLCSQKITEGRQHYLRFKTPETWQHWQESGLKKDSSTAFSDRIGFRAGVCYSYPVFDVVQRKELTIKESPLIIMDTALKSEFKTKENMLFAVKQISKNIKRYSGELVLLWHNSNLENYGWENYSTFYKKILKEIHS